VTGIVNKLQTAVAEKKIEDAKASLREATSALSKAVTKGVLKPSRRISPHPSFNSDRFPLVTVCTLHKGFVCAGSSKELGADSGLARSAIIKPQQKLRPAGFRPSPRFH
jgi:hypothetical protein